MRRIVFLISIPLVFATACNQPPEEKENKNLLPTDLVNNPRSAAGTDTATFNAMATMDFKDSVLDFGAIVDGDVVTKEYEFANNGRSPLIISNANGSCGCTVADFPRKPVAPGESGIIKVQFNSAGKVGHQEKSVSFTTNSNRGSHILYIKGEVKAK